MTDLLLAMVAVALALSGGPAVLLPLGALWLGIALARLVQQVCYRRRCRSEYGPGKAIQMASAAIGIVLALTGLAAVPHGLASLGGPVPAPPVLGAGAVLAAACLLRFSLARGKTAGATPLSLRRMAFAGGAATVGLTAAASLADPLMAQLTDFVAMMVVALLVTAAGVRLAVMALLELIDAHLPPAADAALRERIAAPLAGEPVAELSSRRVAGRLYLDIALARGDASAASDLCARAARLRDRVAASLGPGADLTVRVLPSAAAGEP